jgi:hypothetical protein
VVLPAGGDAARLLSEVTAARDLSEVTSASCWPCSAPADWSWSIRGCRRSAAARPISIATANAEALSAHARSAGALEQRIGRRPRNDASLESFVFRRRRRDIGLGGRSADPSTRSRPPSVAMRPALQDAVFPTVAMACGPGEIAYLAQLREVFEGLGVRPALPVPRFGATCPAGGFELIEAAGAEP